MQDHQQFRLRLDDVGGDEEAEVARLHDALPEAASLVEGEVLIVELEGDRGGWRWGVAQGEAGKSQADQVLDLVGGRDLDQLRHALDDFVDPDAGVHREEECGVLEVLVVGDGTGPKRAFHQAQGDGDALGRNNGLEEGADLVVERGEARAQVVVIVLGEVAGFGVEREYRQGAGQLQHVSPELLGVATSDAPGVLQQRDAQVYGVQQPEVPGLAGIEIGQALSALAPVRFERLILGEKDLDFAPQNTHEILAGRDAQARRDESRVEHVGPRLIANHAREP